MEDEKEHGFLFHKIISIISCCIHKSFINWRANNDGPLKFYKRIEQRYLVTCLLFCTHILSQSCDINHMSKGEAFYPPPVTHRALIVLEESKLKFKIGIGVDYLCKVNRPKEF